MHHIYIHQNKINYKIYVGYTANIKQRWYNTKLKAFSPRSREYNKPLYHAIRRDGWDGFFHTVIETFDNKKDALEAEKFWIEFFRSNRSKYGPEYGYNLHEGGNVPPRAHKGMGKGRKRSEEVRLAMSLRRKGKPLSQETKNKISIANKGKIGSNKNKKFTEEHKEKIRQAHLGQKQTPEHTKKHSVAKRKYKLTDQQILDIKQDDRYMKDISSEYKISEFVVWKIKNNKGYYK